MLCFAMKVPTTNSMNSSFKLDDAYHPCIEGLVYVIAENVAAAAKMVPIATNITLLGPAFVSAQQPTSNAEDRGTP